MLRILLVRPGSTSLDDEGRIKGSLDIPLSHNGECQVAKTADELIDLDVDCVYSAPCTSAQQTAKLIGQRRGWKVKTVDCFRNLDQGLWQGKLIDEVRRQLPKVYRQYQESPATVCPPGGETIEEAELRVRKTLSKLIRKHRDGVLALVIPEPLASVVRHLLVAGELGDLWKASCDHGHWELIPVDENQVALT